MPSRFQPWLIGASLVLSAASAAAQASFTSSPADPTPNQLVQFNDTTSPTPTSWSWSFGDPASGDANTSSLRNPTHVFTSVGVYPVTLTVPGTGPVTNPVSVVAGAGACEQGATFLCLDGGRFQVSAIWTKPDGTFGEANAVKVTDDSGYFWFFDPTNIEMVVKVLDGCALNSAHWVFAAGLTNVQVDWRTVDTTTGIVFPQHNNQGTPFAPLQATTAFPSSCP